MVWNQTSVNVNAKEGDGRILTISCHALVQNEFARIFLPSKNSTVCLIEFPPVSTDSNLRCIEEYSEIDNEDSENVLVSI